MALDNCLKTYMPHTVTIHPFSANGNYGEPTYGTSRTAKAYVEPGVTHSETDQVAETYRGVVAYIADTAITVNDKIVLPDSRTPDIASVAVHTEVAGLEHTVVNFR